MDQLGPDRKEPDPGPDIEPPSGAPPTAADAPPAPPDSPAGEPGTESDATQAYATPVDTDAAVHTEVVEPPPVHAFVPEQPLALLSRLNPIPGLPLAKVLSVTWPCLMPFLYAVITFPTTVADTVSPLVTPNCWPPKL